MANQTKLLRQAVGATICMDTEVTSTGVYPVEGQGIKAHVDSAIVGGVDDEVTETGTKAVKGSGIYSFVNSSIANSVADDVTEEGTTAVKSSGIYTFVNSSIATEAAARTAANVAASEATDVAGCVTSINAILTALKDAGLMSADPVEEPGEGE